MSNYIHFLNTGSSDCIILESNGHFAMIDSGEDNDYPKNKPHLNLQGYEDEVCDYLIKRFADINGKVVLDFVLGTHAHSDHIGGFDTVVNHPMINVKRAYLKPYNEKDIFFYERLSWDNLEVYTQMKNALVKNNVPIVEDFDNLKIKIGDIVITFLNGKYKKRFVKYGENINSVVTLVECNNNKALLVGDLNNKAFDEYRIANEIGEVDLLKVGHHGYPFSSSIYFLKKLNPKFSVVCNKRSKIYPQVKYKLTKMINSKLLCSADSNGIKFNLDTLSYETDIMP